MTDEAVAAQPLPEGMIPLTIKDQMGNEYTIHAFPEPPFGIMDAVGELTSGGTLDPKSFTDAQAMAAMGLINDIFNMAFPPNEGEMLADVLRSPGGPPIQSILTLFTDLLEGWFPDRPTGGSNDSPGSDGPTETTSAAPSSSPAAAPNPFQPATGSQPST